MKITIHGKNIWVWQKDHEFTGFMGSEFGTSISLLDEDEWRYRDERPPRWERDTYDR